MSIGREYEAPATVRETTDKAITLTIRGKTVRLWPQAVTIPQTAIWCLLALNNPEVDGVLRSLNIKVADSEGTVVFDPKTGWVE